MFIIEKPVSSFCREVEKYSMSYSQYVCPIINFPVLGTNEKSFTIRFVFMLKTSFEVFPLISNLLYKPVCYTLLLNSFRVIFKSIFFVNVQSFLFIKSLFLYVNIIIILPIVDSGGIKVSTGIYKIVLC